jgi:hypothetical protein
MAKGLATLRRGQSWRVNRCHFGCMEVLLVMAAKILPDPDAQPEPGRQPAPEAAVSRYPGPVPPEPFPVPEPYSWRESSAQ